MKTLTLLLGVFLFTYIQPGNDLGDTYWQLAKVKNDSMTWTPDSICHMVLHFDSKGHYNGYSGWNNFHGTYTLNPNGNVLMDDPIRTKRAGRPECEAGETLYNLFSKAQYYSLHSDSLIITTSDSTQLIYLKDTKTKNQKVVMK